MAGKRVTRTVCGIEISAEERTPLVEALLRVVDQLRATHEELREANNRQRQRIDELEEEVRRLKGLPETPKRPPQPSPLNRPVPPSNSGSQKPKPSGGKRPGSAKRAKTRALTIHEDVPLLLDSLPAGTKLIDYHDFFVQNLRIEPHNVRYRRARYRLPDGTFTTAPLPANVDSHFGPTLRQYVLYQHFHNQVTQPLLHEELRELGVDISAGQVNRLLTEGHELFHQEKDSLLPAAREVSSYLQTDDTSARHEGKSGPTLHIGNDLFASFFTTDTKSRVNFLKILLSPHPEYLWNGDALYYLECFGVSEKLRSRLEADTGWSYDEALRKIEGKKSELLLVLDRPEIPLHNNLSENDIRQYVKKRKISAGTRSDAGRRCRDTFLSLKTTCRKLGVTFWQYLQDRIQGLHDVPPLADLIRRKASEAAVA